ncbi:MAG: hypothetical protein M1281_13420 [Chloroflexi bacterium]|nr:hypothetical protein [Chloroflexota bacterium]
MLWLNKHSWIPYAATFVLMLLAVTEPWVITQDGVPPPEYCRESTFLLKNGSCAGLLSGVEFLSFFGSVFWLELGMLFSGAFPPEFLLRETLFFFFPALILLPFFSTLFLISLRNQPALHKIHTFICALARDWVSSFWLLSHPIKSAFGSFGCLWD